MESAPKQAPVNTSQALTSNGVKVCPLTAMRIRFVSCLSASLLALVCLTVASPAPQSADQPAATLKVQVREVVLPVTVRDKHGALVASLKIKDFTLTEDGRPQTIKSFTRETGLPYRLGLLVATLLRKRIKMQGFIIFDDYAPRWGEFAAAMAQWVQQGKVKVREDFVFGLENAPEDFIGLLQGKNFGELVIALAHV